MQHFFTFISTKLEKSIGGERQENDIKKKS